MTDIFKTLNAINVNENTEKKGNLTYLSWAWAWTKVKEVYPDANYKIKTYGELNKPYLYDEDLGYMVFTQVTIEDTTHEMWLPVMDFKNKAMMKGQATMFDINKTIMRCLTKNLGMFGLGLYIYAGEDLPAEVETDRVKIETLKAIQSSANTVGVTPAELIKEMGTRFNKKKPTEMTEEEGQELLKWLEDKLKGE